MKALWLLSILSCLCASNGQDIAKQTCSADIHMEDEGYTNANVILGALFPIHGPGSGGFGCGSPITDLMQPYAAAKFAINFLNNANSGNGYLPGVRFGLRTYDTCGSPAQSLNYLQQLFPSTTSYPGYCLDASPAKVSLGVLGPLLSSENVMAAAMAGKIPTTVLSPSATSTEFSDRAKYPTFLRTVPSVAAVSRSVAALLKELGWRNTFVVYVDDAFGTNGYQELLEISEANGICISQAIKLSASGTKDEYRTALLKMKANAYAGAVIIGDNVQTQNVLQAASETTHVNKVQWILYEIDLNVQDTQLRHIRGALTVIPKSSLINQFREYFINLENNVATQGTPWFKEWYESVYKCSLTSVAADRCQDLSLAQYRSSFVQSGYVLPTIKAVFAYAEAIRLVCGTVGVCSNLRNMSPSDFHDRVAAVDFTFPANLLDLGGEKIKFDVHGDIQGVGFEVLNFKDGGSGFKFENIGLYENEELSLRGNPIFYDPSRTTQLANIPNSLCPANGCSVCLLPPHHIPFNYKPGDLVLASLVTGHQDGIHPLSCSKGLKDKLVSLVAMEWAINNYKQQNTGALNGVSLGSLSVDICSNPSIAQSFLTDLMNSNKLLDSGASIPHRNIIAFVDDTSDSVAQVISPLLSYQKIPEIQVGATAQSIRKSDMFPYFARAVPNEDVYAMAISQLLTEMKWMHVQVVSPMEGRYHQMAQVFQTQAARHGICVVQTVDFGDGSAAVVNQLAGYQQTKVVIVFGDSTDIKALLFKLSDVSAIRFQIIAGTKEWATDTSYLQVANRPTAQSAITFGLEIQKNTNFQTWLSSLTLSAIRSNEFLTELFEVTNECSLLVSTEGLYSRVCTISDSFTPYQANAPYIIESIFHISDQLDSLLKDICGNTYDGLCPEFRATQDIPKQLYNRVVNNAAGNRLMFSEGEGIPKIIFYVATGSAYLEFARYDTAKHQFGSVSLNNLNSDFIAPTQCSTFCVECQYLYKYKSSHFVPGDWNLVGAFSASLPGPQAQQPYACGDVRMAEGAQFSTAMFYAIDRVNRKLASVSVNGITIGGLALDHCGNQGLTKLLTTDMYAGFMKPQTFFQESILAWMTDTSSSTNEAADILDPLDVAMVSPSATSTRLSKYDNFFSTLKSDAVVSTAIVKLAKQLGFRYLQLVHSANDFGRDAKLILDQAAQTEDICISRNIEFTETTDITQLVKDLQSDESHVVVLYTEPFESEGIINAIVANPAARESLVILQPNMAIKPSNGQLLRYPPMSIKLRTFELEDYKTYLDSSPIDNVFFARFYMAHYKCNVNGYSIYNSNCPQPLAPITDSPDFRVSEYDLTTVNAVYASVDALDRTIKEYCAQNYSQPCPSFLMAKDKRERFNRNLNLVAFIDENSNSFRFLEREGNVEYIVSQYDHATNEYIRRGVYGGIALNLKSSVVNTYASVQSQCDSPSCLQCSSGLKFSLIEGDIYLGGVFDIHWGGLNPFICGNIKTLHGYLLLEAFHYALEKVNSKNGQFKNILNNVKIGGVGLDACSHAVRGGYLVSNVNNGLFTLSRGGVTVDPKEIDTYIGSYSGQASAYLARILTDLEIPQISFGAASTELKDTRKYPYLYRTVPSNDNEAVAMLKYLDEKNIRYVQIVYQGNSNGINARDEFVKMAEDYNICVSQSVIYPDIGVATSAQSKIVVATLLENPAANTVVTLLDTDYVNSILRIIDISEDARDVFRFLGSHAWADNLDALTGAEQHAVDSVTLKLNADDVEDFEGYINSKTLATNLNNPWFEEYYQKIHNCYTSRDNMNLYRNPCPDNLASTINSINYQQDPGVVFVINSVYAAAFAIDKSLTELCGKEYSSVCQAYRNNGDGRESITKNLANVEFQDPADRTFRFIDRQPEMGYRFYALVPGGLRSVVYKQIGTYNPINGELILSPYTPARPWKSGCDREDACTECPAIRYRGKRYAFLPDRSNDVRNNATTIVAFFDIHKQGVDPFRCGDLNMAGFQQFLAFFYTFGQLPSDKTNDVRILAIDTCSNPMRVDQDLFGLLQGTGLCNTEFENPYVISYENIGSVLVSGDDNTEAAARVLEPLSIPYVSPNAKSTKLDHNVHLARTSSPISGKMKYIADKLKANDWTSVNVLYQDSADGIYPWERFNQFLSDNRMCLGRSIGIRDVDATALENILPADNQDVQVVVLIGNLIFVKNVLTAADSIGVANDYVWILGTEMEVTESFMTSLTSASGPLRVVSLKRISENSQKFIDYMRNIEYDDSVEDLNRRHIPKEWFEEFYQITNDCTLSSAVRPINPDTAKECDVTTQKSISIGADFQHDMYVMNTIASTIAVMNGPTSQMSKADILAEILATLWNMRGGSEYEFTGTSPLNLKFNDMRWWEVGYDMTLWEISAAGDVSHRMVLDLAKELPDVSSKCEVNTASGLSNDQPILATEPRNYYRYDKDGVTKTYDWPVWAVVLAILTSLGLLVTFILFLVLLVAYPKKGGASLLGYMAIIGIFCIYGINFAFFINATDVTCTLRRFLMGVVYMITFAPLLIKSIDNWRYGHVKYSDRRYSGISSWWSLILSALFVVLIQCIVPIIWLILEHPTASEKLNAPGINDYMWCDPASDYDLGLVLSFSFVVFIILITSVFSALAYDVESNNYESRWILFSCIITAGCFMVWMIVTTNAGPVYRDPTVAIANFVNATMLLIIIPFRKAVLMCQARRDDKYDDEYDGQEPYDNEMYQNGYENGTFQLDDYDNQYVDAKPSEY